MNIAEANNKNIDFVYSKLESAFNSAPLGSCPVVVIYNFTVSCFSENEIQNCQYKNEFCDLLSLLEKVISFSADEHDLEKIKNIAESLSSVPDNVLCSEIAEIILKSFSVFGSDYRLHMENKDCEKSFKSVPCSSSCPAHVDIPGYIALTKAGKYSEAIRLIRRDNPFPSVYGFVCDHPCEQSCRRNKIDSPVNIHEIKRYAVENSGAVPPPPKAPAPRVRCPSVRDSRSTTWTDCPRWRGLGSARPSP